MTKISRNIYSVEPLIDISIRDIFLGWIWIDSQISIPCLRMDSNQFFVWLSRSKGSESETLMKFLNKGSRKLLSLIQSRPTELRTIVRQSNGRSGIKSGLKSWFPREEFRYQFYHPAGIVRKIFDISWLSSQINKQLPSVDDCYPSKTREEDPRGKARF